VIIGILHPVFLVILRFIRLWGNWKNIAIKATSAKSQIKSFDRMPDPGSLPSAPLNPVMDWNRRKIILF
jgi:hypothetical protein